MMIKLREKKKARKVEGRDGGYNLNRIVLKETCIKNRTRKKTPMAIKKNMIPGRGDHKCKV